MKSDLAILAAEIKREIESASAEHGSLTRPVKTIDEAKKLAEEYLAKRGEASRHDVVIVDDSIIETAFGWIFGWNTKRYLEAGDFWDGLFGNVPLFVDRANGSVHTCAFLPIHEISDKYGKVHYASVSINFCPWCGCDLKQIV